MIRAEIVRAVGREQLREPGARAIVAVEYMALADGLNPRAGR